MFGQPQVECNCSDITNEVPDITFSRMTSDGTDPNLNFYELNGCFEIAISSLFFHVNCSNYFSIELDFSDFPPCLCSTYKIQELDIMKNEWKPFLENVQIPSKIVVPIPIGGSNNPDIFNSGRFFRFCPSGNVDCGFRKDYKIKSTIILKHPNGNGGFTYENCTEQESIVSYLDRASGVAENPNYIFLFSPLPVKNILNVSCSTLNSFDVNLYDFNGNLINSFKNLNNSTSIDLSNLIIGVYYVQILDKEISIQVKKFSKE